MRTSDDREFGCDRSDTGRGAAMAGAFMVGAVLWALAHVASSLGVL